FVVQLGDKVDRRFHLLAFAEAIPEERHDLFRRRHAGRDVLVTRPISSLRARCSQSFSRSSFCSSGRLVAVPSQALAPQTRTVVSALPDARRRPSGPNASAVMLPPWPGSTRSRPSRARSTTWTVASAPADQARYRPSGERARPPTSPLSFVG